MKKYAAGNKNKKTQPPWTHHPASSNLNTALTHYQTPPMRQRYLVAAAIHENSTSASNLMSGRRVQNKFLIGDTVQQKSSKKQTNSPHVKVTCRVRGRGLSSSPSLEPHRNVAGPDKAELSALRVLWGKTELTLAPGRLIGSSQLVLCHRARQRSDEGFYEAPAGECAKLQSS